MNRFFILVGSLLGFLGVIMGAFAAHAIKGHLDPNQLATYEVGVRYQMYHAIALIVVGLMQAKWPGRSLSASGWLFIAGVVLFSGSLYAMSISGLRWLGAITPIGGCAFLVGWLAMAWGVWVSR